MKKLLASLLLVTAVNIGIYIYRDAFQFVKYSTHKELYGGCDASCRDKWDDYLLPYSEASLAEGKALLHSLRLDTGSTLSKVSGIGRHLYQKFHRQAGCPADTIHRSAPLQQYKLLSADTAQRVWCGTYAQMFSFLCWSEGIVCRNLEIFKPGDHHILNECFLPEVNRWMMVDVTNNLLWAKEDGRLLNAQEYSRAIASPKSLVVQTANSAAPQPFAGFEHTRGTKNYYRPDYPFLYYHAPHLNLVYAPAEKWKRYLLPVYWYEIFSPVEKGNFLFWLKPVFLALWLILAGTTLLKFLK